MSIIYGHPSLDLSRVVGGQMGGFVPPAVPTTSFNGSMTLFTTCEDSGGTSKPLNLVIHGGNPAAGVSLPLFVFNDTASSTGDLSLFIKGAGDNPGYFQFDNDLNLHVQRGPNAGLTLMVCNTTFGNSVSLFVKGSGFAYTSPTPPAVTSPSSLMGRYGFGLFRFNVQSVADMPQSGGPSLPLMVLGGGGTSNNQTTLFISGANPSTTSDSMPLVVPNSVGFSPGTISLYTHGFNY